jgi:hypothetical protein
MDRMQKTRYVDLDGTLAHYVAWEGPLVIGPPIPEMVAKVRRWLALGDIVIVFTARMGPPSEYVQQEQREAAKRAIEAWCLKHLGVVLPVTSDKGLFDVGYDDRMRHIVLNTGLTSEEYLLRYIGVLMNDRVEPAKILDKVIDLLNDLE